MAVEAAVAVEATKAAEAAKAAGGEMAEAEAQLIAVHCNPTQIKTG